VIYINHCNQQSCGATPASTRSTPRSRRTRVEHAKQFRSRPKALT